MPILRVEMWEGRTPDQKRELAEVLTRETARIARCSPESIYLIFEDIKKENWAAGGLLCSEKHPS